LELQESTTEKKNVDETLSLTSIDNINNHYLDLYDNNHCAIRRATPTDHPIGW
jgi:hypothetical protein